MNRREEEIDTPEPPSGLIAGRISVTYSGMISKIVLEVGTTYYTPTVLDVPVGASCLLHVWGKNTTLSAQQLGVYWKITDPDGVVIEEYSAWEAWPYSGAGVAHEFIGGRFLPAKIGSYKAYIYLYMNKSSPVAVASWIGRIFYTAPTYFTLEVDITPIAGGYVRTLPASKEGKSIWNDDDTGSFEEGKSVQVTAVPNEEYEFQKWSADIEGGTSTKNPDYVQEITRDRSVKAHFVEIDYKVLDVKIETERETPPGYFLWAAPPLALLIGLLEGGEGSGGSIKLSPVPLDNEGHYAKGTKIQLTAIPNPGFDFFAWTGEVDIKNTSSLRNTVTMSENHNVGVRFTITPTEEPPETECTAGAQKCLNGNLYECQGGEWVLIEEDSPTCATGGGGEGGGSTWLWIAGALGLGAIALAALTMKKKPEGKTPKKA